MNPFAPEHLAQTINPWTWWLKASDNVNGLVNITNYKTGDAHTEQKIVQEVAGYGMQINIIEQLLTVLLAATDTTKLNPAQQQAVKNFTHMMQEIEAKKEAIALEQLSNGGVEGFLSNLHILKEKQPQLYATVAKKLKEALSL